MNTVELLDLTSERGSLQVRLSCWLSSLPRDDVQGSFRRLARPPPSRTPRSTTATRTTRDLMYSLALCSASSNAWACQRTLCICTFSALSVDLFLVLLLTPGSLQDAGPCAGDTIVRTLLSVTGSHLCREVEAPDQTYVSSDNTIVITVSVWN
jgi:hypothetical protein